MCVSMHTRATVCMWRSHNNLPGMVLSSHHVCPSAEHRSSGSESLYWLSHLARPTQCVLYLQWCLFYSWVTTDVFGMD